MIQWRTKYYFISCGAYGAFSVICAAAHAIYLLVFTVLMAMFCWKMAYVYLEMDAEELMNKLDKGE